MSDPRILAPRCVEPWAEPSGFGRSPYRCDFRAGHKGLHYCEGAAPETARDEPRPTETVRWGTEDQLAEEIALAKPTSVITVDGDLNAEITEALRRAFRLRKLP